MWCYDPATINIAELGMDFWNFSKSLKELRLMSQQPGYRFVLIWVLVAMQLGLCYVVLLRL